MEFQIRSGAVTIRRPAGSPEDALSDAMDDGLLAEGDDGTIDEVDPEAPIGLDADDDDAEGELSA